MYDVRSDKEIILWEILLPTFRIFYQINLHISD